MAAWRERPTAWACSAHCSIRATPDKQRIKFAAELEDLGFRTIWLGGGREPAATCAYTRRRCARRARPPSCRRSSVCGASRPRQWRRGTTGSTRSFGDRFLLGIGAGHPETQSRYERPYAKVTDYLNRLDAAGDRILAALSPKTLSLAGARAAGAHLYLVTPAHTRAAREILGPGPLLAPEHKVVVSSDPAHARSIGRLAVPDPYLSLRNYTNNLLREGFTPRRHRRRGQQQADRLPRPTRLARADPGRPAHAPRGRRRPRRHPGDRRAGRDTDGRLPAACLTAVSRAAR